jgi:DNA-directed RNA polymerase specialized sigma24 family protein
MRQVLSLMLEGLSQREIAEVLGLAENVVSVRLHRARKLLQERMGASELVQKVEAKHGKRQ